MILLRLLRNILLVSLAALFGLLPVSAAGQDAPAPELRGILFLSGSRQFALSTPGGAESGWAGIGDTFAGWTLESFDPEKEILVVSRDGRQVELALEQSVVVDADDDRATLADAEAVMEKMNFEAMFEKMVEQQKAAAIKMARQMAARFGEGPSPDEVAAFQQQVLDLVWSEMDAKQMAADMARVYSEVFTRSELRGLAEFYSTPTGRAMIEKQPEVQERLMAIIQPRMMKVMPRIQQLSQEFAARQQAKQAGDAPSAPVAEGP